ncbi:MAG: DNA polymerase IV [Proteobacteria bacterium]|nr:DNA polymerase IV [Pseudomonadota bacterium]MBU4009228.1 DNA polymerase IV [Pseudomonadota bacterium]MBU4036313.1 DNA polymerase IV [Pseudomonadota bacterium]
MILHIDMDAFFASVEQLDNPDLNGKCVIVGGLSGRGVVAAANYEARKYGIRSAMPMFLARKKCPQAVFLTPRKGRYSEISKEIMLLLKTFSPLVEPVSIDEAYLDISGCERLYGTPKHIGLTIKSNIRKHIGLGCSIGIAPNKFLAKIASDMNKPDGLILIEPDEAAKFSESIPIDKVPGVGKVKLKELEKIGVKLLGDIKKYPKDMLTKRFGTFGLRLIALSSGNDDSPVVDCSQSKSISSETTLDQDTGEKMLLKEYLFSQAEDVGKQLRSLDLRAKTIVLKVKHDDFSQVTRNITIKTPTQSSQLIYKEAYKLLKAYQIKAKVRLIGVGATNLIQASNPVQIDIFETNINQSSKWEKVDRTVDKIKKKFGENVVIKK